VYWITYSPAFVRNPLRLFLCIAPVLLALIHYKYVTFIVADVLLLKPNDTEEVFDFFANAVLPAGISFFTFQLSSFAIDRYRGQVQEAPTLMIFAAYISFFPQLIAGPIVRYHEIKESLGNIGACRWDVARLSKGISLICFGLGLKVLLADTLSSAMTQFVATPDSLSPVSAIYVIFSYSFQIYFDFYGYSLIAIGLGTIFGFTFPSNFARPYEALNIRDFWRRWHMTLSYWIRDYVYVPIGGNQHYIRNILIVFLLCGLWHGAGWTFLAWGLYHGLLVVGYHWTAAWWDRMPALAQRGFTFILVSMGWSLFLFDFYGAFDLMRSLVGFSTAEIPPPSPEMWLYLVVSAITCFVVRPENWSSVVSREGTKVSLLVTVAFAGLMVLVIVFLDRTQGFIYFRF
jgi:alginate O-acetyltransferase complex protein AlgI